MPPSYQSSPLDLARMQNLNRLRDQEAMQEQNQNDEDGDPNAENQDSTQDEEEDLQTNDNNAEDTARKKEKENELTTRAKKNILKQTLNQGFFMLGDLLNGFSRGCNLIPVVGSIISLFPMVCGTIANLLGRMGSALIDKEWNKINQEMKKENIQKLSVKIQNTKIIDLSEKIGPAVRKGFSFGCGAMVVIIVVGGLLIGAVCALPGVC